MRWSKLKQRIEENFAIEISSRVAVHLTRHRGSHDGEQHGRILVDNEVWFDACTFKTATMQLETAEKMAGIGSWGIVHGDYGVQENVKERGYLEGRKFPAVLFDFLNISIDDALASKEPLTRILAVLDKRVGKRRLANLAVTCPDQAPERKFIDLRVSPNA